MEQAGKPQAKRSASVRDSELGSSPMTNETRSARQRRMPKMCKHSSGQARVILNGKTYYCGLWGSIESYERYSQLIREWQGAGEQLTPRAANSVQVCLSIGDLLDRFLAHVDATGRYRKHGVPTTQRQEFQNVCDSLRQFAGRMPIAKCTEGALVAWRDTLERKVNLTRKGINRKVGKVLHIFRWGRERNLVPKPVCADVSSIVPLKRGQVGERPESGRPRRAVSFEEVEKVAKSCSPQVGDMLLIQALSGMRPGEVLALRWADIDKMPAEGDGSDVWLYRVPGGGKTSHHGHQTLYYLPKAAQVILQRYPATPLAKIFSPQLAMTERRERRRAARKSKLTPSQSRRDASAARDYADRWDSHEYRRHIVRACKEAGCSVFTPHEVRHGYLTWAATKVNLVAASAAANHRSVGTTERYVHAKPEDALMVVAAVQARIDARIGVS